jgi:glycerol-3-phosphate dehydrogenase subunit B
LNYDVIVVGAGLAGLSAGLRLAEEGRRVLILAKGVGATHLTGGTIDVLGYGPERVESPSRTLPAFVSANPDHPYARLPGGALAASIDWFKSRIGAHRYVGSLEENFLLPTAVGVPKPSAIVPESMAGGDLRSGGALVFVGFLALKDFYPAYVAENLARAKLASEEPIAARGLLIDAPLGGEADVNTMGFARRFDDPKFRRAIIRGLGPLLEPGERVGFPAMLGLSDPRAAWQDLQDGLGTPLFEVPTLPPSIPGIRVFRSLKDAITRAGGRIIIGSTVVGAETKNGRVERIVADTAARPAAHGARSVVLASGGFSSGAITMSSSGEVRETILDLPVTGVPERRQERFAPGYFDPHPMGRAGLLVDERLRPVDADGRPVYDNLYVAGAMLAGADPWREKSGDGISLATGYWAAGAILEDAR